MAQTICQTLYSNCEIPWRSFTHKLKTSALDLESVVPQIILQIKYASLSSVSCVFNHWSYSKWMFLLGFARRGSYYQVACTVKWPNIWGILSCLVSCPARSDFRVSAGWDTDSKEDLKKKNILRLNSVSHRQIISWFTGWLKCPWITGSQRQTYSLVKLSTRNTVRTKSKVNVSYMISKDDEILLAFNCLMERCNMYSTTTCSTVSR